MPTKVKKGALSHEASARQQELAEPKQKRNAEEEPMPWQVSQDYNGPQVCSPLFESKFSKTRDLKSLRQKTEKMTSRQLIVQ